MTQLLVRRRASVTMRLALLLVVVAGALWGITWWRTAKDAPVQNRIAAATLLLEQGKSSEAETQLREATQLAPDNPMPWELLSDLYWQQKNWTAAKPALERLLKLEPDSKGTRMRLAQCSLQTGDKTQAHRLAEEQLQSTPDSIEAHQMLATLAKASGQSSERLEHLQRIVELQPQAVTPLREFVDEQEAQGNFEQALPLAERLVQLAPKSPSSFYLRGVALYTLNTDRQMLLRAKSDFEKILQLSPHDPEGHRFLARVLLRLGDPQKAIAQFVEVQHGRPYATGHYLEMASAYRSLGNTQEANKYQTLFTRIKGFNSRIEDGREQLHVHPDSVDALVNMANVVAQSTSGEEAFFQLTRFRLLQGRLQSASFYLHKAESKNPKAARVQTLLQQIDQQSISWSQAALVALKNGDKDKAIANMFRALLLRPEGPATQSALKVFSAQHIDPIGTLPPPAASTKGLVSPTK